MKKIEVNKLMILEEALSTAFWFKLTFKNFLQKFFRQNNINIPNINWDLTKREVSSNIINTLNNNNKTEELLALIYEVTNIEDFSEFDKLVDKKDKKDIAIKNIEKLKKATSSYFDEIVRQTIIEKNKSEFEKKKNNIDAFKTKLSEIHSEFLNMLSINNTQERGYKFEKLLYEIFLFYDLNPKHPFKINNEQIDGAFSFDTTEYILEAKYIKEPVSKNDITIFQSKINTKLDNTLGLFISMSGFTENATELINSIRCNYLLMSGKELILVLENRIRLDELLRLKKEYCASRGITFYEFKGEI